MSESLLHGTRTMGDFDAAWRVSGHGQKLRAIRAAAEKLRERFASGPRVLSVRTLPLSTLPYPTRYAFWGAALSPVPFLTMTHRAALVQFLQNGALKNLLFNPTDVQGARTAPFFSRLIEQFKAVEPLLAKSFDLLETQLERLGVHAGDIDYVAFDHFHTQDLRGLLGTLDGERTPRFPNATLLAPRVEWDEWDDLHPMQRAWFVADGKVNVQENKVAFTRGDLALGDGVMLLRTPGHTMGNQTLFFNTENGVWGISENGTCVDNWSPLDSRIPGLASTCRRFDMDILLNANTPEGAGDQYSSMVLERTIVDRVRRAPAFVQMFSSSEVTPGLLAPALTPTLLHGAITSGEIVRPLARPARGSKAA